MHRANGPCVSLHAWCGPGYKGLDSISRGGDASDTLGRRKRRGSRGEQRACRVDMLAHPLLRAHILHVTLMCSTSTRVQLYIRPTLHAVTIYTYLYLACKRAVALCQWNPLLCRKAELLIACIHVCLRRGHRRASSTPHLFARLVCIARSSRALSLVPRYTHLPSLLAGDERTRRAKGDESRSDATHGVGLRAPIRARRGAAGAAEGSR